MYAQISYRQELFRKAIHISSLWMVIVIAIFPKPINILLFSLLLIGCILTEYGNYRRWSLFTMTYGTLFGRILRGKEKETTTFRLSGAPYVIAAALLSVILFPKIIAMTSFTVMLLGDTAAALIGRRFGVHKINHGTKSLEGSIAFFITGILTVFLFQFLFNTGLLFTICGIIGVFLACLAEVYENRIHIDDNFSIPLIVGIIMCLPLLF